ncbi:transmembrane protein, putative [Medicago truncatula]|uniref:Transmembrane protein, putative n=1 Tax=Medicago truncatula TaxID=3880 RepID=A0A072VI26_MEDTR|nr:transmembrane protein, putative [Medicago truncatula]
MFWSCVVKWIGVVIVLPMKVSTLLEIFSFLVRKEKGEKGALLDCCMTLWLIWKAQNENFFYR